MGLFDKLKGIIISSGFKLHAESPLDVRTVVDSIEERDELATSHAAYEGMLVRVKGDKTYEYQGSFIWTPMGADVDISGIEVPADKVVDTEEKVMMTSEERQKLEGIATNANYYEHPTGEGYEHIPAGGLDGQYLKKTADGYAWSTIESGPGGAVESISADKVIDSETKVMMTSEERELLASIKNGETGEVEIKADQVIPDEEIMKWNASSIKVTTADQVPETSTPGAIYFVTEDI